MSHPRIILYVLSVILLSSCNFKTTNKTDNTSSEWIYLFNGKDLEDWTIKINHHDVNDNYANTFRVVDSTLQINYDGYSEFGRRFGHIYYNKPFSSYHLKFEYRFTDQWMEDAPQGTYRNSGVMIHSQDPNTMTKDQDWPTSVEYQILAEKTAGEPRTTANVCTPKTEVFFKGEMDSRHCVPSNSKTYTWNQWLSGEIIVYQDSLIKHIVERDTVLQYTKPQISRGRLDVNDINYKNEGQLLKAGYIALQAEGQGIEFREIKIKTIN
ncbi:3-keto-disaccharide hydrolase [Formosa sp. 4Alg 33]|uniref:3-keto-disaccharide hydrolase n=1 Tax=Formosa sp. 4Alg 33 TaxID=3382189 RepID=UPI003D9C146C